MCTAISFLSGNHYFGRNLDLEFHYRESVTVTPRHYPLQFRNKKVLLQHYAIIGIATVSRDYPLYYDAVNEMGLGVAGLNFPGNATYHPNGNIAPFELIPWILCQCASVDEAIALLQDVQLAPIPFSAEYALTDLHWFIADKYKSITVEPLDSGLVITHNPVGVLTNNPPFDYHLYHMRNYMQLSENDPQNKFAPSLDLTPYSRGMGAMGLPGDVSSASRFIRAAFTKLHSIHPTKEEDAVNQFFHILNTVSQTAGCVRVGDQFEKTIYTSCCNTDTGTYYYKTYDCSQIQALSMNNENLSGKKLISYPLRFESAINFIH